MYLAFPILGPQVINVATQTRLDCSSSNSISSSSSGSSNNSSGSTSIRSDLTTIADAATMTWIADTIADTTDTIAVGNISKFSKSVKRRERVKQKIPM